MRSPGFAMYSRSEPATPTHSHTARSTTLFVITCNRDDFLTLALKQDNPGLIILIRRDTQQIECAHLLTLLDRAGETGIAQNINFG